MGRPLYSSKNEAAIAQDNEAARAAGLTYGKYKSLLWQQAQKERQISEETSKKRKKSYTDEQAFSLWQQGKTDKEIGIALGVSPQNIQRWRSLMEIPSNRAPGVDTSVYRLVQTKHGAFVEPIDCEN